MRKYLVTITYEIGGHSEDYLCDDLTLVNHFLESSGVDTLNAQQLDSLVDGPINGYDWYDPTHEAHVHVRAGKFIISAPIN